jgi:hypothetical protein
MLLFLLPASNSLGRGCAGTVFVDIGAMSCFSDTRAFLPKQERVPSQSNTVYCIHAADDIKRPKSWRVQLLS